MSRLPATSPMPGAPREPSPSGSKLTNVSLLAAAAALFAQSGFRNLLWFCAIVGAPVATVGFVYQVVLIHQERLQHEFVANAAEALSRDVAEPALIDVKVTAPSLADARPDKDLRQALFAMLITRARFVDVQGIDTRSMTPAFRSMALEMLEEDDRMFRQLQAEKQKDRDTYLFDLRSDEGRLRVLHAEIESLVPRMGKTPAVVAKPRG